MKKIIFSFLYFVTASGFAQRVIDYVDPFIGTAAHGHTYPGAAMPLGMVQLSQDNGSQGWDWCSGYNYSDSLIQGFSHTPLMNQTTIKLANAKTFTVTVKNLSDKNIYIQSATLNGKVYTKSFIKHSDIIKGGILVFIMGEKPSVKFGVKDNDRPANKSL